MSSLKKFFKKYSKKSASALEASLPEKSLSFGEGNDSSTSLVLAEVQEHPFVKEMEELQFEVSYYHGIDSRVTDNFLVQKFATPLRRLHFSFYILGERIALKNFTKWNISKELEDFLMNDEYFLTICRLSKFDSRMYFASDFSKSIGKNQIDLIKIMLSLYSRELVDFRNMQKESVSHDFLYVLHGKDSSNPERIAQYKEVMARRSREPSIDLANNYSGDEKLDIMYFLKAWHYSVKANVQKDVAEWIKENNKSTTIELVWYLTKYLESYYEDTEDTQHISEIPSSWIMSLI